MSKFKPIKRFCSLQNTKSFLRRTPLFTQLLNIFVFPFPSQWNKQTRTYQVSLRLLILYWSVVIYKLVHISILTTVGINLFFNDSNHCPNISLPVLFTHITALLVLATLYIYSMRTTLTAHVTGRMKHKDIFWPRLQYVSYWFYVLKLFNWELKMSI